MADLTEVSESLSESAKQLPLADRGSSEKPLILVVLPRIVDLVIQQDRSLTHTFFTQRRKSYALSRESLLEIVDPDELGLEEGASLAPEVVLVAQSRQRRLAASREEEKQLRTWRLAFQAIAVHRLETAMAHGDLPASAIHERIDQLGRDTFSEIEAILIRESRLLDGDHVGRIYSEFLALYAELTQFAPTSLKTYFPALLDQGELMADLLVCDLDVPKLFEDSRPPGASDPVTPTETEDLEILQEIQPEAPRFRLRPNEKRYLRTLAWGDTALARKNPVVAAILYRRAGRSATSPELQGEAKQKAHQVIGTLVSRLQGALDFDTSQAGEWQQSLLDLFEQSYRGFWNTNKRLLYDLQKVCVDYEREISTVDIWKWVRTLGKRPIRRPLPNQREVLMSKHLRSASSRLAKANLTSTQRERLSKLLRAATTSAETQLRDHLRPRIARSLNEKGLRPENVPEQVARKKLVEELLDCIVRRGYLTLGDMRDGISRSQLKLSDLNARELWSGDPILRADRRLDRLLDGVYHRGEFYLRGLQWLSSLVFGRAPGRFIIKYLAVPYGGAFVILKGIDHLWEKASGGHSPLSSQTTLPSTLAADVSLPAPWEHLYLPNIVIGMVLLGTFLLGLLYAEGFRTLVWAFTQTFFRGLKLLLLDFPKWVFSLEWARFLLRSRLAKVLRRYLVTPLIPTAAFYFLLTFFFDFNRYTAIAVFMVLFTGLDFFLNSSFGRRFEERVGSWVSRVWYQFRAHFIRSVFDFIMAVFQRFIESVERVLYAIDEWLLFKTGESKFTFWAKGILGSIWAVVAYGVRFCITLLVEPQINPIKHFPVVTVSHKIMVPFIYPFALNLIDLGVNPGMANTIATTVIFVIPGIFGFLVWELKSNWRLYQANRNDQLKPVPFGGHGHTLLRLVKPGFHSGAVPKLYARMRRAERQFGPSRRRRTIALCQDKLHHHAVALQHFVERDLLALWKHSPELAHKHIDVSDVILGPNSIRIRLRCHDHQESPPLELLFSAQQDWLVTKVAQPGWLRLLSAEQQAAAAVGLAGLYQQSGVDFAEEQLRRALPLPNIVYHLTDTDLEVWAGSQRGAPVHYSLRTWGTIRPSPSGLAKTIGFQSVTPKEIMFSENAIPWDDWVLYWSNREPSQDTEASDLVGTHMKLLPA